MRILHYSLGFPPYRRGGLTKYCLDLMAAQEMQGNVVAMCWPGEIGIIKKKKVAIKKRKKYNIGKSKIENYEIQGILPVPLLEGIKNPDLFTEKKNPEIWKQFLKNWRPDVIHFHTLMGLPLEYVETARKLGIKTVFTTHDYFGLCPRTTCNRQGWKTYIVNDKAVLREVLKNQNGNRGFGQEFDKLLVVVGDSVFSKCTSQ